jgi:hypothetical protein
MKMPVNEDPHPFHRRFFCAITLELIQFFRFDGMMVSLGKEASTGVPVSELIHNEIVVYDPAQVNIRYIIKLNFKFPEGDDILNFFD